MAFTGIPDMIANAILGLTTNKYLILLLINVLLLVVGTFMDVTPAILIFTPILLPICKSFGMDPIHFGILLCFNLSIGTITPPVGTILFTGCRGWWNYNRKRNKDIASILCNNTYCPLACNLYTNAFNVPS